MLDAHYEPNGPTIAELVKPPVEHLQKTSVSKIYVNVSSLFFTFFTVAALTFRWDYIVPACLKDIRDDKITMYIFDLQSLI